LAVGRHDSLPYSTRIVSIFTQVVEQYANF
jgi:hypothetical protein